MNGRGNSFESRIKNLSAILSTPGKSRVGALIVMCRDGAGWEDIYYLSGFSGTSGALVITPHDSVLFVDSIYAELAGVTCACRFVPCPYSGKTSPLHAAAEYVAGCNPTRVAYGGSKLTHAAYRELESALGNSINLIDFSNILLNMRRRKTEEEASHIKNAVDIARRAFMKALDETKAGVSEMEFAAKIEYFAHTAGGDFDNLVPIMVASGRRTSMPHASPSAKKFEPGDLVMVDFCIRSHGYVCDVTRMFSIGKPADETLALYSLARWAQEEAAALIAPGRAVRELDAAARSVMEGASLGENFTHGVGHGIGISVHEMPSINQFSATALVEGDAITLEPGFYKPGWGGIRVEDDYLVTKSGCERLTENFSNELFVV